MAAKSSPYTNYSQLTPTAISVFQHPCLYSGDFNCWHTDWRYDSISSDGECWVNWAVQGNLVLLHNLEYPPGFFGHWRSYTNPDLAFANVGYESWSLNRHVFQKFLWAQHCPTFADHWC